MAILWLCFFNRFLQFIGKETKEILPTLFFLCSKYVNYRIITEDIMFLFPLRGSQKHKKLFVDSHNIHDSFLICDRNE